ncbi:MAG: hypothetical protein V4711_00255 [Pseudomonadota bacterium]
MRHLIFALMIALLPLRGWIGDAMATDMAVARLQTPASSQTLPDHASHADAALAFLPAMHDCAESSPGQSSPAEAAHCDSCSACQACHTVALSPAATRLPAVLNAGAVPHAAAAHFSSADAATGLKPPIS